MDEVNCPSPAASRAGEGTPHSQVELANLPHRPPFVFVRQILRCEPGEVAECSTVFSAKDPMFAGHFPGNPLVPGVLLTEALAQCAGIAAASGYPNNERPLFLLSAIRGMKFFSAVRPEEEIILEAKRSGGLGELLQFAAEARVRDRIVARGELVLSLAPTTIGN